MMLVLLPMCYHTMSQFCRNSKFRKYVKTSNREEWHMRIGWLILILSLVHTFGWFMAVLDLADMSVKDHREIFEDDSLEEDDIKCVMEYLFLTLFGITGVSFHTFFFSLNTWETAFHNLFRSLAKHFPCLCPSCTQRKLAKVRNCDLSIAFKDIFSQPF